MPARCLNTLRAVAGTFVLGGLLAATSASATRANGPEAAARPAPALVGRSVEGRPLELHQFGQGPRLVLFVGPFDGRQLEGVVFLDRLIEHLSRFPRRLGDVAVAVVRDPNPDGRARGTLANARGVHLDRNFFSTDWRKTPLDNQWVSGPEPESEPETRAVADLLADLRPELVIVVGAAPYASFDCVGLDETRAEAFASTYKLRRLARPFDERAGSWLSLVGVDRGLAGVQLNLAPGTTAEWNWAEWRRAVLALVDGAVTGPAAVPPPGTATAAAPQAAGVAPGTSPLMPLDHSALAPDQPPVPVMEPPAGSGRLAPVSPPPVESDPTAALVAPQTVPASLARPVWESAAPGIEARAAARVPAAQSAVPLRLPQPPIPDPERN